MKTIVEIIRYYPILVNAFIAYSCFEYMYLDCDFTLVIYPLIGQSFMINALLFLLSYKYKFCLWHRLMLLNMSFALLLEWFNNMGIEINYNFFLVMISTSITFILTLIYFVYQWKKKTAIQKI